MTNAKLTELLQRLSPHGGGLDRDLLLFEAGKAAVRPSRLWPTLAGILAATQAGLLAILFWPVSPGPSAPAQELANIAFHPEAVPPHVSVLAHWLATGELPQPSSSGTLSLDGPPLRAADWRRWEIE